MRRPQLGSALCLALVVLLSPAARAGAPIALDTLAGLANAKVRVSVASAGRKRETLRPEGLISLRFGPISWCGSRLVGHEEFSLHVFADPASLGVGRALGIGGGWRQERGRVVLEPDPVALREELTEAVAALCAQTHGSEACAETLGPLEPRLGRTRLSLATRERGGEVQARLRGRFELSFVDPALGETAVRSVFTFREDGPLPLVPFPSTSGVCLTVIGLGAARE